MSRWVYKLSCKAKNDVSLQDLPNRVNIIIDRHLFDTGDKCFIKSNDSLNFSDILISSNV